MVLQADTTFSGDSMCEVALPNKEIIEIIQQSLNRRA